MYDAPFSRVCTMDVLSPLCSDIKSSPGIVLLTSCIGGEKHHRLVSVFTIFLPVFYINLSSLFMCCSFDLPNQLHT